MELWLYCLDYIRRNPGKTTGAVLGLIWGLIVLWLGLFWALFLTATTLIGYWLGKKIDDREDILEQLQRWLSSERS